MTIAIVGMLDEREEGLRLIKSHIENKGHQAILMDISIGTGAIESGLKPEVDNQQIVTAKVEDKVLTAPGQAGYLLSRNAGAELSGRWLADYPFPEKGDSGDAASNYVRR